jgi:small Trp-rich protein
MYMLAIGVALLVMKLAEVGPGADLSWWWVLAPFAVVPIWWSISDATGLTRKQVDAGEEQRRIARVRKHLDNLRGKKSH